MIAHYLTSEGPRWGTLLGQAPKQAADQVDIAPFQTAFSTTGALIQALAAEPVPAKTEPVRIAAGQLMSPVTRDAQLICQGLNYGEHASQSLVHVRKRNLLFMKASSSLSGAFADIVQPDGVRLLDYEVEIGLVLRTHIDRATVITDENIGDYVAGVVLCNDVSARDVMFGATFLQWFEGKSFRTFCPTGPILYLLEPHEVAATLANLEIKLWLNGELRQSALSTGMIFKPTETLTHLSRAMDLKCGDLLLTGTPGGVIAQPNSRILEILVTMLMDDQNRQAALCDAFLPLAKFLAPGDVVTAGLRDVRLGRDLGGQRTRVAAPAGG
jgi:2-keto-4-pentenoate hydratase/2-oxohepta-3-ene-1,7-dioic acid hydratase in catechol pathway